MRSLMNNRSVVALPPETDKEYQERIDRHEEMQREEYADYAEQEAKKKAKPIIPLDNRPLVLVEYCGIDRNRTEKKAVKYIDNVREHRVEYVFAPETRVHPTIGCELAPWTDYVPGWLADSLLRSNDYAKLSALEDAPLPDRDIVIVTAKPTKPDDERLDASTEKPAKPGRKRKSAVAHEVSLPAPGEMMKDATWSGDRMEIAGDED